MGITIVQKSNLSITRPAAKKALILAGGAIAGGSFKAGGLKALGGYFSDFRMNDFDIFVGISSGSIITSALMGGISVESILKSLDGTSSHFSPLTAWHCYRPNFSELLIRPAHFLLQAAGFLPGKIADAAKRYAHREEGLLGSIWQFVRNPSMASYEEMVEPLLEAAGDGWPSLLALLPSGLFDNAPIEQYIRNNIERNGLTNDFRRAKKLSGKSLYISAMRLDGARRIIFGPDENHSLTISEAIQASTALPGFYKPARIHGVDYVDGGVHETANIDTAVEKGAKLIVCYNPFRPYARQEFVEGFRQRPEEARHLSADGVMAVLNQIFRALFHTRLKVALEHFRKLPSFKGDIILIEPRADDRAFFALNPLSLGKRVEAARLGFESVRNSIEERFDEIAAVMAAYGITMNRQSVEGQFKKLIDPKASEEEIQSLLEGRDRRRTKNKKRNRSEKRS